MSFLEKTKNRVYFVGGISGTGKSTLLEALLKTGDKSKIISGSKYFMQWLGLKVDNYELLQSLPYDFKNKELDKMIRYLISDQNFKNKSVVINAHYLRIINGEITNVIGDWVSLFNGLFIITSDPEIILERLNYDETSIGRNRNIFQSGISKEEKIKFLRQCQTMTIKFVQELSMKFNIPYFIIKNNSLKEALKEIKNNLSILEVKNQ